MSKLSSRSDISCTRNHFDSLCHACQLGHHARLPFSSSSSRADGALDLLQCDLWTSTVFSLSNYKYYLVILDGFPPFSLNFSIAIEV